MLTVHSLDHKCRSPTTRATTVVVLASVCLPTVTALALTAASASAVSTASVRRFPRCNEYVDRLEEQNGMMDCHKFSFGIRFLFPVFGIGVGYGWALYFDSW